MRTATIPILFALALLAGCTSASVCRGAYYEFKTGECCLDENNNHICDNDEAANIAADKAEIQRKNDYATLQQQLADAKANESVYDIIATLKGRCWYWQQGNPRESRAWRPNETDQEPYGWYQWAFTIPCSTSNDCTAYLKMSYVGLPGYAEGIQPLLQRQPICSETRPTT